SLALPAVFPQECRRASDATRRATWRFPSLVDQVPAKSPRAEARRDAWEASRAWEAFWSSALSSMIVLQIDIDGVAFHPTERDPPVSACVYRIAAPVATDKRVKAEPGQIHVLRPRCVIERT